MAFFVFVRRMWPLGRECVTARARASRWTACKLFAWILYAKNFTFVHRLPSCLIVGDKIVFADGAASYEAYRRLADYTTEGSAILQAKNLNPTLDKAGGNENSAQNIFAEGIDKKGQTVYNVMSSWVSNQRLQKPKIKCYYSMAKPASPYVSSVSEHVNMTH